MSAPRWWENKINLGNVVSWAVILATASYVFGGQSQDLRALQAFREETKRDIAEFRAQRGQDREALLRMEGDIRVIRQILEQPARSQFPPRSAP